MRTLNGSTIIDGKLRVQIQAEFPVRAIAWSPLRHQRLQRQILSLIAEYVKAADEVDDAEREIDASRNRL